MFQSFVVETSLTTKYNRTWLPDIRELLQNAFDGVREDFPHLEPFSPQTVSTVGDGGGVCSKLFGKDKSVLLEIVSSFGSVVMRQRRKPHDPLSRAALYMYSEKSVAKGDLGGFGEGMKICALQLLKNNCTLVYMMSGEKWTFFLQGHKDLKAGILAVRVEPFQSRLHDEMLEIVIRHVSNDCRLLFTPNKFLRLIPQPVLFLGGNCQFLDLTLPNGSCLLFVNGILMKETSSISFSVNLRLSVDKLSPDRDTLRVTESFESSVGIQKAILDPDSQENRFKAQRACLEVLEKCKGEPREDLKLLIPRYRVEILEFLRHERQNPRLFPIIFDAPEKVKQTYRLLNYTPLEMHSASYFSNSIDFDAELAEVVSKAPLAVIPNDAQTRFDLASLQKVVSFVNEMFARYGACVSFEVKFVAFQVLLTEPITFRGVVYLHGGLFDPRVINQHFRGYFRGQVFILLFSMAVVMNPGLIERRILAHIQFQLSRLVNDPNVVLCDLVSESILGDPVSAEAVATPTKDHGGSVQSSPLAVPSPPMLKPLSVEEKVAPFATVSEEPDPTLSISDKLKIRPKGMTPERTGAETTKGSPGAAGVVVDHVPHSVTMVDFDDAVPPMERFWMHDSKSGQQIPLYMNKGNGSPPPDLARTSAVVRLLASKLIEEVFPKLKGCLFYCYFKSRIMAYYEEATTSIFVNLYFCGHFSNVRELFLTICHELAHLSGFHRHDTHFADAVGKIVLDHSAAFIQLTSKLTIL